MSDYGSYDDGFAGLDNGDVPVPLDPMVGDALSGADSIDSQVDEVLDDIAADPSLGQVADDPGASDSPLGDFAPTYGDVGHLVSIMNGITEDPEAPVSGDDAQFLHDETIRNEYWNNFESGVQQGNDIFDDVMGDMRHQQDEDNQLQAQVDTINEINREVDGINSMPGVGSEGPTELPLPWPDY